MSITNIISNRNVTIVQGINGICLCEESWVMSKEEKETLQKLFRCKNEPVEVGEPRIDPSDLTHST